MFGALCARIIDMDTQIYKQILTEVLKASETFDGVSPEDVEELKEDFETIFEDINISKNSSTYTGGIVKFTTDLLDELKSANTEANKQKCIESIVMIRASMMDVEAALSNAADSLEKVVVSIRDA